MVIKDALSSLYCSLKLETYVCLYLQIKIKFGYGYVMLENLLFEFTPALEQTKSSLNKIKQIGIDKSVSLSNESLITIGEFGFIENRSPIVKRDLDRCDLSACDGKEPEKPVVPEDFGPKRPRLSSPTS